MGMLYYLPNAKSANPDALAAAGLSSVIDRSASREVGIGPDGQPGLLVCQTGLYPTFSYHRDQQIWAKRYGSDVWIGFDQAAPPGPEELARRSLLPGREIELADGRKYTVPLLRSFDAAQLDGPLTYQCLLDQTLAQDPDTGRLVPGDVLPKYREVWAQAMRIGDSLLGQLTGGKSTAELEDGDLEKFVAAVLSLNYRVQMPELSALGLLTLQNLGAVMRAAIDWDTLQENLGNRVRRAMPGTSTAGSTSSGDAQPIADATIPTAPPLAK